VSCQFRILPGKYVNDILTGQIQGGIMWLRRVFPICKHNSNSIPSLKIYNILNFVHAYIIVTRLSDYRRVLNSQSDLLNTSTSTPHKSLLHSDQCSQSRCSASASNGERSSASGFTSSQAGDHLTPTSYFRCRLQTNSGCPDELPIQHLHGPHREHRLQ
jgi:hypothetical protein